MGPIEEALDAVLWTVRWRAVLLGLGAGVLGVAVAALAAWWILSILDFEGAAGASTTFGVLSGFVTAGWVAGRRAFHSHWFHGALAGLTVAGAIVVVSILGGSPAPAAQVILLAGMAILLGGLSGHRSVTARPGE